MLVSLGDYVCYGDPIARVRAPSARRAELIADRTRHVLAIERQRKITRDPGYGIQQLATVGWTSISSAKSDPLPGLSAIHNLRDLLERWHEAAPPEMHEVGERLPVVYRDDVPLQVIVVLESLLVAASESMQHQCAAESLHSISAVFERLPPHLQARAELAILRGLSTLGDHVLTGSLDDAPRDVARALRAAGCGESAAKVEQARSELGESVGTLSSRGDRGRVWARAQGQ